MSISFSRATARLASLCLLSAGVLATVVTSRAAASAAQGGTGAAARKTSGEGARRDSAIRGHYASTPVTLNADGHTILAYPPSASAAARPLRVVYLHGIHGRPENGCPWLRAGASELGWLVCPEASTREPNGTASWGGDVFAHATIVTRALRAAEESGASNEPGVAVGFSQGGYVALDLVKSRLARFRGLVLIAAPGANPNAQKLREAGVVRVAFASGALDAAYGPLVEDTRRLQSQGIDARFFDLGKVGHTYVAEETTTLREAIAWAGGRSD